MAPAVLLHRGSSLRIDHEEHVHGGRPRHLLAVRINARLERVLFGPLGSSLPRWYLLRGRPGFPLLQDLRRSFVLLHNEVVVCSIFILDLFRQLFQSLLLMRDLVLQPLLVRAGGLIFPHIDECFLGS